MVRLLVTVAEAKAHLRVETDDEDALVERLVAAAQAAAADFCATDFADGAPEPVRLAILLHTGYFYAHREGGDAEAQEAMARAFRSLLWPYRDTQKLF